MNLHKRTLMSIIFALSNLGFFASGCGEEDIILSDEKIIFDNPKSASTNEFNLGEDEAKDFSFHRIYHNYGADSYGLPYVSSWSSYFDPGLVDAYIPYIWEHPFYTYAFLFGGY